MGLKESPTEVTLRARNGLWVSRRINFYHVKPLRFGGLFVIASCSLLYLIQTSKDRLIQISSLQPINSRLRGIWISWKNAFLVPSLVFLARQASCWPAQLVVAARAIASSWNCWNKEDHRCSLQVTPWKFALYWLGCKIHFFLISQSDIRPRFFIPPRLIIKHTYAQCEQAKSGSQGLLPVMIILRAWPS